MGYETVQPDIRDIHPALLQGVYEYEKWLNEKLDEECRKIDEWCGCTKVIYE